MEKQAMLLVGHKEGRVYMQHGGTEEVPANYVSWDVAQARETAALILMAADRAERDLTEDD